MTLLKKAYLNRQDAKIAKETKEYIRNFDQFMHFVNFIHLFIKNLGVLGDLAVFSGESSYQLRYSVLIFNRTSRTSFFYS
jgi:hypothetical protein